MTGTGTRIKGNSIVRQINHNVNINYAVNDDDEDEEEENVLKL